MVLLRRFSISIAIVCSLNLLACQSHEDEGAWAPLPSAPGIPSTQPAIAAPTPAPTPQAEANNDDARALAQKVARYTQTVSPLLNKPVAPTTQPSVVAWVDLTPPQPEPAAATQPAATQPAPQTASLTIKPDGPAPLVAVPVPQPTTPAPGSSDDIEKNLRQLAHDYPRDLNNQLDYQLFRFVRDESTPDLLDISGLSSEDREILSSLMDGLSNFRSAIRDESNPMLSRKIQPLLDMADRLRGEAELQIPTVALCTRVDSFGVYKPIEAAKFPTGRQSEVILYCEVGNFSTQQNSDHFWETRLKQDVSIYTDTGNLVWPTGTSNAQEFVDLSRNRRHDFFIPRRLMIPADLAAGKYLIKITLTDEESSRVAEATTAIEIGAD